jgi:ATP-dependent DNA helicase 2 subunit 2
MAVPLTDFKNNISQGDVVSKAVEDLGWVVKEIVLRPFAERRHAEMIECLNELREVCLEEDEIDAWNRYVCMFII